MTLQVALVLLGIIAILLVVIVSYGGPLLSKIQFKWPDLGRYRKPKQPPLKKPREPSLVPATEFSLEQELVEAESTPPVLRADTVPPAGVDEEEERLEEEAPVLERPPPSVPTLSQPDTPEEAPRKPPRPARTPGAPLKLDYWARIPGQHPIVRDDALGIFRQHEMDLRHPHGIYGRTYPGNLWRDLQQAKDRDRFTDLVATLQLADRGGPTTESELTKFNNLVFDLAEQLDRRFRFDSTVEEALDQALILDEFCRRYDVLAIVNVVSRADTPFNGPDIARVMERSSLRIGDMNLFHFFDVRTGRALFSVANRFQPGNFDPETIDSLETQGLTLFMSVPRTQKPGRIFDQMISVAEYTCAELDGQMVDQNGQRLSSEGVARLRDEIGELADAMGKEGVVPGDEETLRLF